MSKVTGIQPIRKIQIRKFVLFRTPVARVLLTPRWSADEPMWNSYNYIKFKGATKSHIAHYSCVVIVLLIRLYVGLHSLRFLLGKLAFHLSVVSLNQDIKICIIVLCKSMDLEMFWAFQKNWFSVEVLK